MTFGKTLEVFLFTSRCRARARVFGVSGGRQTGPEALQVLEEEQGESNRGFMFTPLVTAVTDGDGGQLGGVV